MTRGEQNALQADCHDPTSPPAAPLGTPRVVVAGNPNAGKSTLFNALTGGAAHVGNFAAGTTVSRLEGRMSLASGGDAVVIDVPGTFSLAATSPDERVAMDAVLGRSGDPPDLVLVVGDAPRLARSLYLALQVIELGVPALLVVNLLDEARAEGLELDLAAVSAALGVPVVGTVARSGEGVDALRRAIGEALVARRPSVGPAMWSDVLDADVDAVARDLPAMLDRPERARALARWALLSADAAGCLPGETTPIRAIVDARRRAEAAGRDLEGEVVAARYAWIDAHEPGFVKRIAERRSTWTEPLDRFLLHPVFGTAAFVAVMMLTFAALFSWADPAIGLIEAGFGQIGAWVTAGFDAAIAGAPGAAGPLEIVRDFVVAGLIGGVGSVLVFLPQIGLLFLFLAVLEDCGYLARAAHLADRVLRAAGLPGRAFVPLLSGYACAVPAILATRTLPRFRDRLLTILVIPLTSCSARLPVYTLIIAAVFPATIWGFVPARPLALAGMYLFSTSIAIGAAIVLGRTLLGQEADRALLELPPYRLPHPGVVLRLVVSRCMDFVREAGGMILAATMVLWVLLSFPRVDAEVLLGPERVASALAAGQDIEALAAPLALEQSFAGRIGRAAEPVIAPLGYDWRIGIGLLGAFAAREVFVSTMGVVYGVGADSDEESVALRDRIRDDRRPDGTPTYTPLVGASILVFFALALQCLSTLAVMRKETGGWAWPTFSLVSTGALAWVAAFVVYQGGLLLGFH